MKLRSKHLSPIRQEIRKKVNMDNTATTPVLWAFISGGAGLRENFNLLLSPPPCPHEKPPSFGNAKPLLKEPDRDRG